jgi:predicted RNase H-like HicB family nuclease
MSYKVNVVIKKDEYGYYAYCLELEGCQTQGDTLEEVLANVKEAIELYLETLSEDENKNIFEQRDSYHIIRGKSWLSYRD